MKNAEIVFIFDILPAATIRPKGSEKMIVKKKIPNEKPKPWPKSIIVETKVSVSPVTRFMSLKTIVIRSGRAKTPAAASNRTTAAGFFIFAPSG